MDIRARIQEHYRRGEYVQVRRLGEALSHLEASADSDKAFGCLWAAEAAYRLDDAMAAIHLAQKAVLYATSAGEAETEGRAWFRLIGAQIMAGDHQEALDAAERFLSGLPDRWPQLEDPFAGQALCNVAMTHRNRRRYPEALQAYWQALIRFQRYGDVPDEILCRQEMAWLLIRQGDLDDAEQHLEAAGALLSSSTPGHLAVYQLTHEAYLRLHQGRTAEAVELAEEVLTPGRAHVSQASRAAALMIAGTAALRTGCTAAARTMLKLAQEAATQSGLAAIMNFVGELAAELQRSEAT